MSIEVDTSEYRSNNDPLEFNEIVKTNQTKEWFFHLGYNVSFAHSGTFFEACEAVKTHFINSKNANYGIIKLSKIQNIKR